MEKVFPHPNADRLELAHIKGWQCCLPKGKYHEGDLVVYIPIDSVVPEEWSERWGVTQYLSHGRVRCARLRGEPSFGLIVDVLDPSWAEGQDVRESFGITKYVPPYKPSAGDAERAHPLFVSYTDIENLRNFPEVIPPGAEVEMTEKIHGTCGRIGIVEGELMAGSMGVRRRRPEEPAKSTYWFPLTLPGVEELLAELGREHRQVILFGEIFGQGIQSLHYGQHEQPGFRAFDLMVDGRYLGCDEFHAHCGRWEVPQVPLLYRGPFSLERARELSAGRTTLADTHIREGVVVKPVVEATDPRIGRVVLKYISDDYLLDRGISDTNDV